MKSRTPNDEPKGGILAALRHMVPERALKYREALIIVEHQAKRLRELLGVHTVVMPDDALMSVPHTHFTVSAKLPASGATHWQGRHWLVVINATEPYTRQRFSAAHELFHIIAHPRLASLTPTQDGRDSEHDGERLADYFAGVLLVPGEQLHHLWTHGTRQLDELAAAFIVSKQAITVRLKQVGLLSDEPRRSRRDVSGATT